MARLQGHNRLIGGFSRVLTKSEVSRGYLFISNDQEVRKLKKVELIANGNNIGEKKIDNSGRISVGQAMTKDIGKKDCHFRLKNGKIFLKY